MQFLGTMIPKKQLNVIFCFVSKLSIETPPNSQAETLKPHTQDQFQIFRVCGGRFLFGLNLEP